MNSKFQQIFETSARAFQRVERLLETGYGTEGEFQYVFRRCSHQMGEVQHCLNEHRAKFPDLTALTREIHRLKILHAWLTKNNHRPDMVASVEKTIKHLTTRQVKLQQRYAHPAEAVLKRTLTVLTQQRNFLLNLNKKFKQDMQALDTLQRPDLREYNQQRKYIELLVTKRSVLNRKAELSPQSVESV